MKNLNQGTGTCRRNGVVGLGLVPENGPTTITIKVFHGSNRYEVSVPSNCTFGYLKSVIAQAIGLNPGTYKLLFRGQEKEDDEDLHTAGANNNSEVLVTENAVCEHTIPEEIQQTSVPSKGEATVSEVRKEVDKLEQQVSAIQADVDHGTKVDDKEIIYLTEMLMRQLLKLDGIEAEGEGKVQRKMEVRRVQRIVEMLDSLNSRNSNASSNVQKTESGTIHQEAFNNDCGSGRTIYPPWETSDTGPGSVNASSPMPSGGPSPYPSYAPFPTPYSTTSPAPYYSHSASPYYTPSSVPYHTPSPSPYYAPSSVPFHTPSPSPYFTPSNVPYHTPSPTSYFIPSTVSHHAPSPMPYSSHSHEPSFNPSSVPHYGHTDMDYSPYPPPSSQLTQNWQQFN